MNSYSPDLKQTENSPEQAGHESEHEMTKTLAGAAGQAAANGAAPAGPGDGAAALHTIAAGIRSGISPLQFMDSIDAGGRQMGNRAFMHWVEQVHTGTAGGATHGIAAQGLQGPGRPLTHLDTLQQAFGHHDIRAMREHTGTVAGSALDALDAEGYTRGGRMALAGAPDLYTQAHEAAHGVQQAALGERMMLPGGIGVAGDRYERQADAVADAVLRGESAQPLLDQVTAGPVQVSAASAGAAAPVQMRRKKHKRRDQPRPEDLTGDNAPTPEQEALEMVDLAGQAGDPSPDTGSMGLEPVDEFPDTGQVMVNPLYAEPANVDAEIQQTAATLEQVAQQLEPLIQEPDVPQPEGSMDVQQIEGAVGYVVEDIVPAPQQLDQDILPDAGGRDSKWEELGQYLDDAAQPDAGGDKDDWLKDMELVTNIKLTRLRKKDTLGKKDTLAGFFFPQAKRRKKKGEREKLEVTLFRYFFPLIAYLYETLKKRAGQVSTEDRGVLSLCGILNVLATVMLGVFMVPALPVDVVGNILGVFARFLILICDIAGIPGGGLLLCLKKRHMLIEPSPEPAEGEQKEKQGWDWKKIREHWYGFLNVFIPQTLVSSAAFAYFHVSIVQGSLSPSGWILEWTPERIGLICGRVILDNIIAIVLFHFSASFSSFLHKMLGWYKTLADLLPVILLNTLNVAVDYIAAYNASPEVTVFQPWHSLRTGVELGEESHSLQNFYSSGVVPLPSEADALTPNEATATFFGYSALGMLITFVSATLVFHHVISRMLGESLNPWLSKFYSIRNRAGRTIAVALAAIHYVILFVMALTNIMGLIVSNIIGPLSREFGSTGFCIWPMAAAGACGGLPEDFDFASLFNQIQLGQEELPESHLTAIQTFPGIVGALGLAIPIGIIIVQLLRKYSGEIKKELKAKFKPRRRGAGSPDREGSGATGRGRRFRGRRRAGSGERISRAEEGGTPGRDSDIDEGEAPGRAADIDAGEAEGHIYELIQSPGGTLRRHGQRRRRPLPATPQQETVTTSVPAEFSPVAANLHQTFSNSTFPMSHVNCVVERAFRDLDMSKEEKDWLLNWARSARNIDPDMDPVAIDRAIALYMDPHGQVVQPPASAQEPGGAGPAATGTHSPQPSITSQATVASIHTPPAQVELDMMNMVFENEQEMSDYVDAKVAKGHISESEGAEIKAWAKNTMLFPPRV